MNTQNKQDIREKELRKYLGSDCKTFPVGSRFSGQRFDKVYLSNRWYFLWLKTSGPQTEAYDEARIYFQQRESRARKNNMRR
jgi:hypothetical protein